MLRPLLILAMTSALALTVGATTIAQDGSLEPVDFLWAPDPVGDLEDPTGVQVEGPEHADLSRVAMEITESELEISFHVYGTLPAEVVQTTIYSLMLDVDGDCELDHRIEVGLPVMAIRIWSVGDEWDEFTYPIAAPTVAGSDVSARVPLEMLDPIMSPGFSAMTTVFVEAIGVSNGTDTLYDYLPEGVFDWVTFNDCAP